MLDDLRDPRVWIGAAVISSQIRMEAEGDFEL